MLIADFFSDHQFDSQAKARELFEFFNAAPAVFRPVGYDRGEPARKPYNPANLDEPIRYLTLEHDAGAIALKGKQHRFLALFSWNKTCVRKWLLELSQSFFKGPQQVDVWIQFIVELCDRFPVLYGVAGPKEDWYAKHQYIGKDQYGEFSKMLGLELDHCLPAVGWMTVFGKALVDHFSRDTLTGLPSHRTIDLHNGGLVLVAREHPFHPEQAERLAQDQTVMARLGRAYFFELQDLHKACQPIPGVTGGGVAVEPDKEQPAPADETASTDQDHDEDLGITETDINELFAAYEDQLVRNIDEKPTTDFDDLAETVVVNLYPEIEEVMAFSRASLEALDRYLTQHVLADEYKYEFLVTIYIPAFGAYVGQVLVRQLGSTWVVDENNLTKSTVIVGNQVLTPFKTAFDAVFSQKKLTDIYAEALKT